MRRKVFFWTLFIFAFAVIVGAVNKASADPKEAGAANRKIVVFDQTVLNNQAQEELLAKFGAVKIKDLGLISGKAVILPPTAEAALKDQPGVLRIDEDIIVEALAKPAPVQPEQTVPWGIARVGADQVWATTDGDMVKVAVIDTGIDLTHPDLQDNIKGGYNAIYPTKSANDDNGHGTHVAGIIAAAQNGIGVVGMGPKIDLYAVKALNRQGSGYLSDIIEGLDWSIANGIQVVNMSLGAKTNVQSFHDAVIKAYQAGLVLVAAAGNDYGGAVNFPAAYPEVVAVSATDSGDQVAAFSSVGPEVDLSAPGVGIFSTYKGSSYKTLSGTSMATPHVAGAAALVMATPVGLSDLDADGVWDPSEVQNKLEATAQDLGSAGKDNLYGSGLLNVVGATAL